MNSDDQVKIVDNGSSNCVLVENNNTEKTIINEVLCYIKFSFELRIPKLAIKLTCSHFYSQEEINKASEILNSCLNQTSRKEDHLDSSTETKLDFITDTFEKLENFSENSLPIFVAKNLNRIPKREKPEVFLRTKKVNKTNSVVFENRPSKSVSPTLPAIDLISSRPLELCDNLEDDVFDDELNHQLSEEDKINGISPQENIEDDKSTKVVSVKSRKKLHFKSLSKYQVKFSYPDRHDSIL